MKPYLRLLLAVALPLTALAQAPQPAVPAKPQLITTYRIFAKPGHGRQLEAALAAHARKFHRGDHAWRVGIVMSGPDAGAYHITEGPTSWTALDGRGDLGPDHTKDYSDKVVPHIERATPDQILSYQTALSTVAASQWTNKVGISHLVPKLGRGAEVTDTLKKWKAVYEKLGLNVAVWRTSWSGESAYALVFRFPKGFQQLDEPTPAFRKAADELFGAGEYDRLQKAAGDLYRRTWSELIEFKPELSSQ